MAIAIVPPEWREGRICVEMLYRPEDLARRDASGRRLYLSEEFNSRNGQHATEGVHVSRPAGKTLVRDEVFPYGSEENVALSKMAFAQAVRSKESGFSNIDFEGFRPTFEVIEAAVSRVVGRR